MLRRLSIPFLALIMGALSTQGCGSNNNNGGIGGASGADGGTGTGGAPGTGGTGGAGGTGARDGGGTDAVVDAPLSLDALDGGVVVAALCPSDAGMRTVTSPAMTALEFCALYLLTCTGANSQDGGYTSLASCLTGYTGLSFETTRQCRSYHVCNAAAYATAAASTHCGHAIGITLCQDINPDASAGN